MDTSSKNIMTVYNSRNNVIDILENVCKLDGINGSIFVFFSCIYFVFNIKVGINNLNGDDVDDDVDESFFFINFFDPDNDMDDGQNLPALA